jgi:hypothetical protein
MTGRIQLAVTILSFSHIALGPDSYVGGAVFGFRIRNESQKVRYFVRSDFSGAEDRATEVAILL